MSRIAQILAEEGLSSDGRTAAAMFLYAAPFLEGYFYLFADDKDTVIHRGYKARLAESDIKAEASKLWKGKPVFQILSLSDFQKRFNSGKKASSYADLNKVLDELGTVKKIRFSPSSGILSATVEVDDKLWSIDGVLGRDGSLSYEATLLTPAKVSGEVFIPYEDHHEAASEMLHRIRYR